MKLVGTKGLEGRQERRIDDRRGSGRGDQGVSAKPGNGPPGLITERPMIWYRTSKQIEELSLCNIPCEWVTKVLKAIRAPKLVSRTLCRLMVLHHFSKVPIPQK